MKRKDIPFSSMSLGSFDASFNEAWGIEWPIRGKSGVSQNEGLRAFLVDP